MAGNQPGVSKGTINNPKGKNQYALGKGQGEKKARLQIVLTATDKHILKEAAQKQGMSLSSWLVEVAKEAASA